MYRLDQDWYFTLLGKDSNSHCLYLIGDYDHPYQDECPHTLGILVFTGEFRMGRGKVFCNYVYHLN